MFKWTLQRSATILIDAELKSVMSEYRVKAPGTAEAADPLVAADEEPAAPAQAVGIASIFLTLMNFLTSSSVTFFLLSWKSLTNSYRHLINLAFTSPV